MRLRHTSRAGYTLLEMMVAMAIGIILLAALYVAIDTQLRQMDEGRTRVQQTTLSRALFQRISSDLTPSLGPVTPPVSSSSGGSGGAGGAGGAATAGGGASPDPSTTQDTSIAIKFSIGVKGDSSSVSIFQTRLNQALINPPDTGGATPAANSDITRITYFLDSDKGLCREEILQASSDLIDQTPTAFVDSDDHYRIVAREVKSFDIRYYDGANWQTSWDGSTPGPDGKTPQGPPRSIEITVGFSVDGTDTLQTYTHTISFPTAPGPSSQTSSSSTSGTTMP